MCAKQVNSERTDLTRENDVNLPPASGRTSCDRGPAQERAPQIPVPCRFWHPGASAARHRSPLGASCSPSRRPSTLSPAAGSTPRIPLSAGPHHTSNTGQRIIQTPHPEPHTKPVLWRLWVLQPAAEHTAALEEDSTQRAPVNPPSLSDPPPDQRQASPRPQRRHITPPQLEETKLWRQTANGTAYIKPHRPPTQHANLPILLPSTWSVLLSQHRHLTRQPPRGRPLRWPRPPTPPTNPHDSSKAPAQHSELRPWTDRI